MFWLGLQVLCAAISNRQYQIMLPLYDHTRYMGPNSISLLQTAGHLCKSFTGICFSSTGPLGPSALCSPSPSICCCLFCRRQQRRTLSVIRDRVGAKSSLLHLPPGLESTTLSWLYTRGGKIWLVCWIQPTKGFWIWLAVGPSVLPGLGARGQSELWHMWPVLLTSTAWQGWGSTEAKLFPGNSGPSTLHPPLRAGPAQARCSAVWLGWGRGPVGSSVQEWDGQVGPGSPWDSRAVRAQGWDQVVICCLHPAVMGTGFTGRGMQGAYHSSAQASHCHHLKVLDSVPDAALHLPAVHLHPPSHAPCSYSTQACGQWIVALSCAQATCCHHPVILPHDPQILFPTCQQPHPTRSFGNLLCRGWEEEVLTWPMTAWQSYLCDLQAQIIAHLCFTAFQLGGCAGHYTALFLKHYKRVCVLSLRVTVFWSN